MSWELILKTHVHQNRIVLAKGFHKVSTLSFRNFTFPSPPVYAHTLLAYTHTHTLVPAYGYYILEKKIFISRLPANTTWISNFILLLTLSSFNIFVLQYFIVMYSIWMQALLWVLKSRWHFSWFAFVWLLASHAYIAFSQSRQIC